MDKQINILLVEDSLLPQKIAKMILEQLGCCVEIAGTGQEAINLFQKNRYNLVFMDLGLPDINGIVVTETLRNEERSKNVSLTPIVALTVHEEIEYKNNALAAGVNDYLVKPLTATKASQIIEKHCSNK